MVEDKIKMVVKDISQDICMAVVAGKANLMQWKLFGGLGFFNNAL